MSFGYAQQFSNGINSNTQLRSSTDMIYQRGATYEVILTGDTYYSTMQLVIDLYSNDTNVGRMSIVPYSITTGNSVTYKFNIRPYYYFSNFVQSEHYTNYIQNDWTATNNLINVNNSYPNSIKANIKYGYSYIVNGQTVNEFTNAPTNDFNHYNFIPTCAIGTGITANNFTNTGKYFNYIGGQFQLDDRYLLQNFDQEVGTSAGTGFTFNMPAYNLRLNPTEQFLLDYPILPESNENSRFLTNAPRIQYIQQDENYLLSYLNGQTGDRFVTQADYAVFEFFNGANTRVDMIQQRLSVSGTTSASPTDYTNTLKINHLPCGPVDITNIFKNVDWSTIAYYKVQLYYSTPTNVANAGPLGPISEIFYFYLYNNCRPENTRLAWINPLGGYDYYTFTSFRQQTNKIERTTFNSRYYSTNLQQPDRNIGRTLKTFDTSVSQEITLQTEYLSLPLSQWIEEMFYSPQVYEMRPDFISPLDAQNKFYKDLNPLQLLSTQVDVMTKKHSKLNKYQVTFQTANNYFTNKGF